MSNRIPITVANSDGIGPEIMAALCAFLKPPKPHSKSKPSTSAKGLSLRQHVRHRTRLVGFVAPHQSVSESANYDATGQVKQESQRDRA